MKYVVVLLIAGGVYLMLGHPPSAATAGKPSASAQSDAPGTDFLKAPLDRTHEVLNQAHTRAQDPALQ